MMRSIALRLRTAPRRFPERLARFSTAMKTTSTDPLSLKVFEDLRDMKDAGTFKTERVIISPQRAKISVENRKEEVINMCANNYLGLSSDPELIEAAKEAMDTHGLGLSSVRFICGTQDIHKELEEKISNFHQTEDTILYPSCFDANAGFFETVLTKEDAIISDALNHASIIDGVRLCKAARFRFDHMCMKSLEENLVRPLPNQSPPPHTHTTKIYLERQDFSLRVVVALLCFPVLFYYYCNEETFVF
mmetsp:Transcript_18996/g.38389  ORF Transcript_18996/g.38389 Transcript_18996/m.38389 type:complete len:248 (-) Transcript_18996:347-1090(-)